MYTINQTEPRELTIHTADLVTYNKIKEILRAEQKQFHSFTIASLKPKSLVLKGISREFEDSEILEDLSETIKNKNLEHIKIIKVERFKQKKPILKRKCFSTNFK